jgi:hypothetical protein
MHCSDPSIPKPVSAPMALYSSVYPSTGSVLFCPEDCKAILEILGNINVVVLTAILKTIEI